MKVTGWNASPQETIAESVRESLENTVEAMKTLWKDGNTSEAQNLAAQMMQQAITLGHVMKKSDLLDNIAKFEEELMNLAFQDDNDWCDVVGHLEVIIRLQMMWGDD